ncbi:MAG: hypothetical protein WCK33_02320 [Phycisphaerae bacterium]
MAAQRDMKRRQDGGEGCPGTGGSHDATGPAERGRQVQVQVQVQGRVELEAGRVSTGRVGASMRHD